MIDYVLCLCCKMSSSSSSSQVTHSSTFFRSRLFSHYTPRTTHSPQRTRVHTRPSPNSTGCASAPAIPLTQHKSRASGGRRGGIFVVVSRSPLLSGRREKKEFSSAQPGVDLESKRDFFFFIAMSGLFGRVFGYVFNELLVSGLANSRTFQQFAVRTDKALREVQQSGE